MAGCQSGRMVRGLRCGGRPAIRLASATSFAGTVHPLRSPADCAFRFGKPLLAVWRIASIAPTLNARIHICQISLRPIARTALTHGLVNGLGWQRAASPLALCCNGWPEVSSPGLATPSLRDGDPDGAHSSRNQETPVCTVLHCVAALRVQQGKPLPLTSHRGRE
jgi:hypothetical protein